MYMIVYQTHEYKQTVCVLCVLNVVKYFHTINWKNME